MREYLKHNPLPREGASIRLLKVYLTGALILSAHSSCLESPPKLPAVEYERRPGKGCGDLPAECADESMLWSCEGRRWQLIDCDEVCEDHGGPVGCITTAEFPGGAACQCEADKPECDVGQTRCMSDKVVENCDPDLLAFVALPCESVCGAMEPPQLSQGCFGTKCDCTVIGTPCAPGTTARCEPYAVARCVDGVWDLEDCLCSPGNCDPWGPEGAACDC